MANFKSSYARLARLFKKSRDKWKDKAIERHKEIRHPSYSPKSSLHFLFKEKFGIAHHSHKKTATNRQSLTGLSSFKLQVAQGLFLQ
jgi:hypothetical protein